MVEQKEEGESSGDKVRFMPRGQVMRYKDGNWETGQEAGPAIPCVTVGAQVRVVLWGGEKWVRLSLT